MAKAAAERSAEKLIILNDIASGLQARFYNIVEFKRPEFFSGELDKFFKAIVKGFPEFPASLPREKGFDQFTKRASEISSALRDYYLTFIDLLAFTEEATKILQETSKTFVDLRFELNVDLMSYYFGLLVKFAQLHVLVSMAPEKNLILSVYAKAHHITAANTEPNFLKIADHLKKFSSPLRYMQEQFGECARRVGDSLMTLQMPVMTWAESKMMMDKKVFSVIEDTKNMGLPSGEKAHLELLHLDRFKSWLLWGFLVCPGGLAKPGALDLIKLVLKDVFIIPVFRDKVLNIHQEYENLCEWFKVENKEAKEKFSMKSSKVKKYFKEASEEWKSTIKTHHELRVFLRAELKTLCAFFEEVPGAIAPKIQMIFAILHLAREEVLWYFRHMNAKPHKQSKYTPHFDLHISDLLFLIHKLAELLSKHKASVKAYYLEYIQVADTSRLLPEVERFVSTNRGISPGVLNMLRIVAEGLPSINATSNFEAIRLNWYRISAALNHQLSGISIAASQGLHAAMGTLVTHSRNVDCLSSQLKLHASFMELFWYRQHLFELLKECLKATGGQAGHCMSFVRILNNALHNVHRICPEEQGAIGKEAVTMCDTFLRTIVIGVEILLKSIVLKTKQLRAQTKPSRVAQRIQQQAEQAIQDAKDAKSGAAPLGDRKQPVPGSESLFQFRKGKDIEPMFSWRKSISEICGAIFAHDKILTYNIEFIPKEYLYESMQHNIRTTLKGISLKEKGAIERPTVILSAFRDVLYAYQTVESYVNINLSDIVRDVMLSEFTDESHGQAGDPVFASVDGDGKEEKKEGSGGAPSPSSSSSSLGGSSSAAAGGGATSSGSGVGGSSSSSGSGSIIHAISAWYLTYFSRDMGPELGVYFSPLRKSFLARPVPPRPGAPAEIMWEAEWFTDVNELRALATLAGPYGFRVLDRSLLSVVSKYVGMIKDVLVRNAPMLQAMANKFTENQLWFETVPRLLHMDQLLQYSTIVGCVLQFRHLLRDALRDVISDKAPFIFSSVKIAHAHLHDVADVDPALSAMDYLAQDCGLFVGEADHSLRLCLAKYKTQLTDIVIWNMLPELYGLSYVSARWQKAQYQIHAEGHFNNMHTVAETIKVLLVTFQRISLKQELKKDEITRVIQADFDRFIRCSAYSILHMCSPAAGTTYPVSEIMLFLEQFIMGSGGRLTLSVLEECFPFTLVRTKYIQMYQKQSSNTLADDDEKKETKEEAKAPAPGAAAAAAATAPAPGSPGVPRTTGGSITPTAATAPPAPLARAGSTITVGATGAPPSPQAAPAKR